MSFGSLSNNAIWLCFVFYSGNKYEIVLNSQQERVQHIF